MTDAHAYLDSNDGGSNTTSSGGFVVIVADPADAVVDVDDLLLYSSLWTDDGWPVAVVAGPHIILSTEMDRNRLILYQGCRQMLYCTCLLFYEIFSSRLERIVSESLKTSEKEDEQMALVLDRFLDEKSSQYSVPVDAKQKYEMACYDVADNYLLINMEG
jgi:hypothetical protein